MRSLIFLVLFAIAYSVLAGGTNESAKQDPSHVGGPTETWPEATSLFFLYSSHSPPAGDTNDQVKQEQARVAGLIEAWPVSKTRFFLYSLNPNGRTNYEVNTDRIFHGFTILGKAEIKAADDPAALLKTFAQGIRENDGLVAFCFDPRHGLRMVVGSVTNDFVICFQCQSVNSYGFGDVNGFLITGSPAQAFNHLVDKYHMKKPKRDS